MELVVDANVLISAFLSEATTRELLLDERLALWCPEYGVEEYEAVLLTPRIRKRLGDLAPEQIRFLFGQLTSRIRVIPSSDYQLHMAKAEKLAPHPEDAPYLALALHLNIPLWSNDLELQNQKKISIFTTQALLASLRRL